MDLIQYDFFLIAGSEIDTYKMISEFFRVAHIFALTLSEEKKNLSLLKLWNNLVLLYFQYKTYCVPFSTAILYSSDFQFGLMNLNFFNLSHSKAQKQSIHDQINM